MLFGFPVAEPNHDQSDVSPFSFSPRYKKFARKPERPEGDAGTALFPKEAEL
jgi:hypothetical protein